MSFFQSNKSMQTLFVQSRKLSTSTLLKMPKRTAKSTQQQTTKQISQPVYEDKNGDVIIKIQAKPGSKINAITDINDEGISVQISAPPVEGEANTELIKYISSILGIKKSEVTLDRGSKSRTKSLTVTNKNLSPDSILSLLSQEIQK